MDEENVKIVIQLDVIKRGKRITTIKGFTNKEQLETIAHDLKKTIGTGGTTKNGVIILQGDHRSKITDFLLSRGISKDSIEII
ncbi:MAG: translation initiation factor [Thermoproteota archaeon]|nr:translation initiation factor [Thermoproteota archaeon]